jgi:thiol-disulfide isomerase/thioredoxin
MMKSKPVRDLLMIVLVMVLAMLIFSMFFKIGPRREYFSNPTSATYFYMENCKYCKEFSPVWTEFVAQYKGPVKMSKVENIDAKSGELEKYNVKSFPTVIVVDQEGGFVDYEGDRTVSALNAYFDKIGK